LVELVQLLLLGVFSGFVAGLLGVGGGLIIVPVLLYVLAAEVHEVVLMHTAIGTALFVIVFTSISSVWAHHQNRAIHWHNFIKLTPTILLGAFCGAIIAQYLSFDFLRIFFALFEITAALIMWFSINTSGHADNLSKWVWLVTGYIIGLVSAIVGIGGGTMTTPFLVYNNINIKSAIATSAAVGMPIAIASSVGFIITGIGAEGVTSGLGFIHVKALLSIVITSVLFAPLGAKVAHSVDGIKLKKGFALFLAFLGLLVIAF
jgi:uncharacterized membrane protein YfcA